MGVVIRAATLTPGRLRLRREAAPSPVSQPAPVVLGNATGILGQEERLRPCQAEVDELRALAMEEGLASGLAKARAEAAEELYLAQEAMQKKAESAISAMEQAHAEALHRLQAKVGEFAFAAVCKLVGETLFSKDFVLAVVEQLCAELRSDSEAIVRLHPRDVRSLQDLLSHETLKFKSIGLKLVEDETLVLGGCVIEAASGRYEAGLEAQLRRLHSVLSDVDAASGHKEHPSCML